ncbi:hypothetical protein [Pedobacter steynii]
MQIKTDAKTKKTKEGQITKVRIAPPPPPTVKTVKFPPPIVKPDAPARPKRAKSGEKVKFPPPIVVPDKLVPPPPPPPPVEPVKEEGKSITIKENDGITYSTKNGGPAQALSTKYRLIAKEKLETIEGTKIILEGTVNVKEKSGN